MTSAPVRGTPASADPGMADRRKAQPSRRRVVTRLAALVVTGLGLYVVLPSLLAVLGAWPKLATLSGVWLLLALLFECGSFVCNFAIQRIVLRTRGWFAVVTAGLAGNAVTNTLPGGDAAGAAVQYRMLATAGVNSDAAAGGLAASSLLGVGGLLMLPILTLPTVLGDSGLNHTLVRAALIGVAAFVVYMGLGALLLETDRPLRALGRAAQWIWNKVRRPHPPLAGLENRLLQERNEIRAALGREWKQIFLLVVGRLGLDYLCLLAALPHDRQPAPHLARPPRLLGGRDHRPVPDNSRWPGDRRGQPERPPRARRRQRAQRVGSHVGLPVGAVLASDDRRHGRLRAVPPALRGT